MGKQLLLFEQPDVLQSPKLKALVAIDIEGRVSAIDLAPIDWWHSMMGTDPFADVFGCSLPKEAGIYVWSGVFIPNVFAGKSINGEIIDDHPGDWAGSFKKKSVKFER